MSTGWMSRWWGPVFEAERVTRARRWQGYALRSVFVLGLLAGLTLVWSEQSSRGGSVSVRQMAVVGEAAFYTLTSIQLIAVLLIAPAATAGAICLDKTRGALAHVFVTDLTNREIILGKLAARLFPVWGLLACALPVMAATTWLGGIDPLALTGVFVIAAGVAFLGCSLALMLSVWASKTHEVLSLIFGVWVLWLLAAPVYQINGGFAALPAPWVWSNPFYLAFAPYNNPGATSLVEPALFALGCLVLGAGFVAVAVARVRVVGCRSAPVRSGRRGWIGRGGAWVHGKLGGRWGPRLDRDPVLWREWHRNRATRWSQVVWGGFALITSAVCGLVTVRKLTAVASPMGRDWHGFALGLSGTVGLLLISTSTASVLAEERARGSLDVLMSTPVSTRAILRAKWWGAFRRVPWLIFWPTLLGIVVVIVDDLKRVPAVLIGLVPILILMQGAALVSLGLALATWIKRTGQATAWTITGLVFMVVGLLILGAVLPLIEPTRGPRGEYIMSFRNVCIEHCVVTGSPIVNLTTPYIDAARTFPGSDVHQQAILILLIAWTLIYGLGAWVLFELTVVTFNRCLGRASERPRAVRIEPAAGSRRRWDVKGWGWKIPGAAGRPAGRAASCEPPPR